MKTETEATDGIHEDEIRSACDSILKSSDFLKAYRMRRLLSFLVEQAMAGDRCNVSEYVIGIEVFDRNPVDYASEDPIVRVQVGRLRQRLACYYKKRPDHEGIEISIPVGQYRPVFRRTASPVRQASPNVYLMVDPIRHIAEHGEGQSFANGLYEELLNQLFSSFDNVFMRMASPSAMTANRVHADDKDYYVKPCHLIEGSVRVDAERIRASIRLVDYSLSRITWARHFDRSVQFGIREQEELAMSICNALKEVVLS